MTDIAARLREVIEERLRVAREARDSHERAIFHLPRQSGKTVLDRFLKANHPADAILAAERDLGVLQRHSAINMAPPVACRTCCDRHASNYQLGPSRSMDVAWPCDEIAAMAKRYGVTE